MLYNLQVNTFIDDLFAFIIRMPTMARMSCFRDDVVSIIYLWQRYLYPVDTSRPVEGVATVQAEGEKKEFQPLQSPRFQAQQRHAVPEGTLI